MTRLSGADAQVLLHRNNDSAERRAGAVRRNDFFEMVSQKWIIKKKHTRTYVRTVWNRGTSPSIVFFVVVWTGKAMWLFLPGEILQTGAESEKRKPWTRQLNLFSKKTWLKNFTDTLMRAITAPMCIGWKCDRVVSEMVVLTRRLNHILYAEKNNKLYRWSRGSFFCTYSRRSAPGAGASIARGCPPPFGGALPAHNRAEARTHLPFLCEKKR